MSTISTSDSKLWAAYMDKLHSSPGLVQIKRGQDLKYKLDLHNLSVHQAYLKCEEFVGAHVRCGTQYVTIITGRSGQINDEFVQWCRNWPGVRKIEPLDGSMENAGSWMLVLRKPQSR